MPLSPFYAKTTPADAYPLAIFRGQRPDAPTWFSDALLVAPERSRIPVHGRHVEVLSWGNRGAPGLLFMHGLGAHADWWSHIAPFFATRYRVSAFSWSGMGGSDWRENYSLEIYLEEILAAAQASGLFEAAHPPLVVGHSYGGLMLLAATAAFGERFKGSIVLDTHLHLDGEWELPHEQRAPPVYSSLQTALSRFRFAPPQACANLFIADHIARASLKPVPLPSQTEPGWTWRFDPRLSSRLPRMDITACIAEPRCPVAFIAGARSTLTDTMVENFVRAAAPRGTPWVPIPDSDHHVMVDQPLALVAALQALLESWPAPSPRIPRDGCGNPNHREASA